MARLQGSSAPSFQEMWRKPLAELYDESVFDESDIVTSSSEIVTKEPVWEALLAEMLYTVDLFVCCAELRGVQQDRGRQPRRQGYRARG